MIIYQVNKTAKNLSQGKGEQFMVEDFDSEESCIDHAIFRAKEYKKLGYHVDITRFDGFDWKFYKKV